MAMPVMPGRSPYSASRMQPVGAMMVLGVSGLANIPFAALLSMLIPLLIGML